MHDDHRLAHPRGAPRRRSPHQDAEPAGIDLVLDHISPGEALFSTHVAGADPHPEVCATMLDLALAAAVQSILAPGESYRRVDLAVTTVRTSRTLEGRLETTALVVHAGHGLLVATGSVRDAEGLRATGRLVARDDPCVPRRFDGWAPPTMFVDVEGG